MLQRTARRFAGALAAITGPGVRHVLRPLSIRGNLRPPPLEGGRRLVLVQLDGISRHRLGWALRNGHMPFLARRLEQGALAMSPCSSGAPSSTPAFQAGLLYGVAPSIPGFVWYDRVRGREMRMDRAADAAAVEASLSERNPPLLRGGTSYFSIFSGGAALPHFCLSGLGGELPLGALADGFSWWDATASAIVHSITAIRSAGRLAYELSAGTWEGLRWSLALGRLKHEPRFLLHRLMVGALMREMAVDGIVIDVARGVPIVYADLMSYDEYAHRRGPGSPHAVARLRSIDLALASVFAATDAVPELRYDVYLFSDHGHVATEPFESSTGLSLPEYLALVDDRVVTAEAGDLAHVYFTDEDRPPDLEAVRARHPGVLSALRESRSVGIVAVRNGRRGVVLVGADEIDLADGAAVARLPHPDPPLLAQYVADLVSLPASGDLVVLGWRGEHQRTIAYAWEFGSHGGVAPEEIETFFLHPPRCGLAFADVTRPDALYHLFYQAYRRRGRPQRRQREDRTCP